MYVLQNAASQPVFRVDLCDLFGDYLSSLTKSIGTAHS